jgi:hypothetical protein
VRFGASPCPSAGRFYSQTADAWVITPDGTNEIWAASVNDSVVLPGSGDTVGGTNVATPHGKY